MTIEKTVKTKFIPKYCPHYRGVQEPKFLESTSAGVAFFKRSAVGPGMDIFD